jgi:metal-responsive CopG/Arc/MetJ family transcriptional regulator
MMKSKIGISIEKDLSEKLDGLVQALSELKISKSELIEAILRAYFKSSVNQREKARELIVLKRSGKL